MRLRWLAAFPLVYAALFLAISRWLGEDARGPFISGQDVLVRLLPAVGCFAAVSAFSRGDHLRRAWLWLGISLSLMLLRDLLGFLPAFQPAGKEIPLVPGGLIIVANLFFLAGIWWLARSWRSAAITLPGGRAGAVAVGLATAALALWFAGPGAVANARDLLGGGESWTSVVLLVSTVVDTLALCLIAPLLLMAVALRGGLFSWPWALLTASQVAWLLCDVAISVGAGGLLSLELLRGVACNYLFAAGVAQWLVVQQVRRAGRASHDLPAATAA